MVHNYAAISCTKILTSTTRVVFANIRIILVWFVAIFIKWESFHWLQLLGFVLLIIGTLIYNNAFFKRNMNQLQVLIHDDNSCNDVEVDENKPLLNKKY